MKIRAKRPEESGYYFVLYKGQIKIFTFDIILNKSYHGDIEIVTGEITAWGNKINLPENLEWEL